MPANRIPLPSSLHPSGFSYASAKALGVPRSRLRASDLHRPAYGIRTTTRVPSQLELIRALAAELKPHHAYAGATAAIILGLPVSRRALESTQLIVASPNSAPRMRRTLVKAVRVPDRHFERVLVDGLPIVPVPLLLATAMSEATVDELVALLDAALTRADNYPGRRAHRLGSLHPDALPNLSRTYAGMHGVAKLRTACDLARVGVESPMESLIRVRLVQAGFPEPEINPEIVLGNGRIVRPDMLYRDAKVTIEYQGDHHRTDRATWQADIERTRDLQAAGFVELQVSAADLTGPRFTRLVARLRQLLLTSVIPNRE